MKTTTRYLATLFLLLVFAQNTFAVTPGPKWKDSYSVNGQCYCDTTYDHEAGGIVVETPAGNRTVKQICEKIGPGPGAGTNPAYNDVQCGNGPPNNAIDEVLCPGRVDMGSDGCSIIGPTWNLPLFFPDPNASQTSEPEQSETLSTGGIPPEPVVIFPETVEPIVVEVEPEVPVTEVEVEVEVAAELEITPTEQTPTESTTPEATGGSTIQPIGVAVAASNFSSSDYRWVLVDAESPNNVVGPDSDGSHTNSALGGKYLELLPDVKVTNADLAASDNVWPIPGDGPQVHFAMNIEQAGTYAVYVRAFSTGEFDDTLHVGFDGLWPESGSNIHTCGSRGQWIWTKCETSDPATITIPTSGTHSIQFAARDDGFEFDQFVLQLLNDDGSPAIQPESQLQAQNGLGSNVVIDTSTTDITEPELGQAVAVGVGSIGFASAPIAYFVLLISGLCLLLHRFETTAKGEQLRVRSDR